jgi:hypothetical protein
MIQFISRVGCTLVMALVPPVPLPLKEPLPPPLNVPETATVSFMYA